MYGRNGYEHMVYDTVMDSPGGWSEHFDWGGLRSEVEAEARSEIIVLGGANAGKSTLYSSLRGLPLPEESGEDCNCDTTEADGAVVEETFGLFTLVDLPPAVVDDLLFWDHLERASLLVYLVDGGVNPASRSLPAQSADLRWVARLQATGRPLLLALSKADLCGRHLPEMLAALERQFGLSVVPISTLDGPELPYRFLLRVVELCPALAVPLGREVTAFRRAVAQRMILQTALRCGLISLEPIPFLDLPIQISAQVGLVARLGTMHGHPPTSDYCKELMVAGAGGTVLRLLAQQASKAVPVVGWLVSGVLGGVSAWILGQSALAYFDGRVTPQRLGQWLHRLWDEKLAPHILWGHVQAEARRVWSRCSRFRVFRRQRLGRARPRRRRPDVVVIRPLMR
ncbi:MAG: hypothetical protein JXA14_23570 [Anaerolineae bacterium]|nr:hypothetical protein [Anaerolineae bacterium]